MNTPWASEKFFLGGELGDFFKIFPGGPKVMKFVFSHSKLRKQPFFAMNFKIQLGSRPTCPPPSDAHGTHTHGHARQQTFLLFDLAA